jgi:hypothetical protein
VAALQLRFLAEQLNEHHILSALKRLPRGLEETYDAALSRITSQQPHEHVALALRALVWLTFAKEHLPETGLRYALAVKDDTTDITEQDLPSLQMILSLCMGLVALEKESGTIRLVHETTQQYLQNYFRKEKEDGDAEIANVCFRYFSFPVFSQEFENEDSLVEHLARYPLSSYASRCWFLHIRGDLERTFVPKILQTFRSQNVRNSVEQLAGYSECGYVVLQTDRHVLHIASECGLAILCREILRPTSKMQSLYFPSIAKPN